MYLSSSLNTLLLVLIFAAPIFCQTAAPRVVQPADVVDAYRVCEQFQRLMAENLDFGRAFEATFSRNAARRREIAIAEGEFGEVDLSRVDDASLITAFKSRMQIFYLTLVLASPENTEQELFFPPDVRRVIERKPPKAPGKFHSYSLQLKRDAAYFRAHLERLAAAYPKVAERIRKFKEEALSQTLAPPDQVVEPLTAYSRGRVLGTNEPYYQINEYAVVREGNEMRIVGIRFFNRLF